VLDPMSDKVQPQHGGAGSEESFQPWIERRPGRSKDRFASAIQLDSYAWNKASVDSPATTKASRSSRVNSMITSRPPEATQKGQPHPALALEIRLVTDPLTPTKMVQNLIRLRTSMLNHDR
jgi:hypothetical protein